MDYDMSKQDFMMNRLMQVFGASALLLSMGAGCALPFGGGSGTAKVETGGMLVSLDGGRTWTSKGVLLTPTGSSSISGTDIISFEQDPSDATVLYAGSRANGLFYSLDGAESWQRPEEELVRTGAIIDIEVDPSDICTYYVLKTDRLIKTSTCGREFDVETYVETRTDEGLTQLAIDWYNPDVLYLGSTAGDIFKSFDGGATWATATQIRGSVSVLDVSNGDSRVVVMGTTNNGFYRTADGGSTWVEYEDQLDGFKDADKVYDLSQTADGSTMIMSSEYGLLVSKDQGFSWADVPLVATEDVTIYDVAVAPTDGDIFVYGTANTLLRSTSGGSAWSTQDLPTTRAASMVHVDANDSNKIYLGVLELED